MRKLMKFVQMIYIIYLDLREEMPLETTILGYYVLDVVWRHSVYTKADIFVFMSV